MLSLKITCHCRIAQNVCQLPVQLSQARKQEGAAPASRGLWHTDSPTIITCSMTPSSSLCTSSMSSADTVLPKDPAALQSPSQGSLRKRTSVDVCAPLVSLFHPPQPQLEAAPRVSLQGLPDA